MTESCWHVYLLECADGSYYTGIAIDVERRFIAHMAGKAARYTRSHKAVRLIASRPVGSRSEALRVELAIKRLPRSEKIDAVRNGLEQTNDVAPSHGIKG